MSWTTNILQKLRNHVIHIGLGIVLVLLATYLLCGKFRLFLTYQQINPNFIIGFFTATALLLSLIQVSKDKRYAYNLKLVEVIGNNGLKVIAKLISIKSKSSIYLGIIQIHKDAIDTGKVYKDVGGNLSKADVVRNMDLVVAYIDMYFPEQKAKWNDLQDKLTRIANLSENIAENYKENIRLIQKGINFKNQALDNINFSLENAISINKEIDKLTLEVRNGVIRKINALKGEFKKTFDFRF